MRYWYLSLFRRTVLLMKFQNLNYRSAGKRSRSESALPPRDEYSAFVAWLVLSLHLSRNRKRLALNSDPVIALSE